MDGYLAVQEVCVRFRVARETIRRWEKSEWFPQRVRLSDAPRGRCGFPRAEIEAWDLSRRSSRQEDPPPDPQQ